MRTIGNVGLAIANPAVGWLIDLTHHEYRLVYAWWATCTLLAFWATLVVYRGFLRYGGMKGYVPPEPDSVSP